MSNIQIKREKNSVAVLGIGKHEPITSIDTYKTDLIIALNYYNISLDEKLIKDYAVQYCRTYHPHFKTVVDKCNSSELRQIGTLGRLILRNQYVSPDHILLISDQLEALKKKYVKQKSVDPELKISIQDRMKEGVAKYGSEVDGAIDDFVRYKASTFDMKQYLLVNGISGGLAKKIGELYVPLLEEISSDDPELIEGYSNFTRLEMRKFRTFIKGIVDCCNQRSVTVVRKPRIVKAKPASVVTSKVQYLKEFPELNLRSADVTKLVGAREVWLYNTKYRKLSVLRGVDEGPLLVRGTGIYNHDLNTSGSKTIRNPTTFFAEMKSIGKRNLNAAYKGIAGTPIGPKTRLNPQTIILAIF